MVDERPDAGHAATLAGDTRAGTLGPGTVFAGRYLVDRLLGRGGMGAVWSALDRELGETVALKILDGAVAGDSASVERFRREVRLARRVTHRNVARIYDIGDHEGTFYLTMELVVGASLADVLASRSRLPVGEAVAIARQIAEGLAAAHAVGVVHRDLKPGNVLIGNAAGAPGLEHARVVVTDFGIAVGIADDVRLTRDHALLGTPAYMSPEQVRGGPVDARSDVYALGLLLYELLTGTLPFAGETALQLAVARLDRDPIDFAAHPEISAELAELVMRCLSRAPEHRPSSAAELATLLARCGGTAQPIPQLPTSMPTPAPAGPVTLAPMRSAATLAVLPLRYRGPADEAYMAETLTDELVDLLSATRGLKVMASGATSKYAGDRDPFTVGRELGVDIVVDGTVQRSGTTVRISARLVDVASGFQTWNGRFDGELADVFELQDRIAKKIAETLRVELETDRHKGDAPAEAIELYLQARALTRQMGKRWVEVQAVLPLFQRCLALAPTFAPALAGHATAALRAWFRPEERERAGAREAAARAAVAAAVAGAPTLAETQLALARLAVQDGRFRDAASAMSEALRIAPTYAEAHEYVGSMMCEAGQPARGMAHLRLAAELDPGGSVGLVVTARHQALEGDRAAAEALLAKLRADALAPVNGLRVTAVRVAAWFGDTARLRELVDEPATQIDGGPLFASLLRAYVGDIPTVAAFAEVERGLDSANPRFRTMMYQLATEALCRNGEVERGWEALVRAANDILVDLHWLDRCPLLAPLREHEGYRALRERVKVRAEAIWQVG